MTRDDNKGISIGRDGLDLPADIRFDLGGASTTYRRWADGTLFRIESSDRRGLVARSTRIGPVRHERDGSAVVAHAEGRDIRADGRWTREYDLRDHLGNTRATFADSDADGLPELLQEDHYYPFGARMAGKGQAAPGGGPAALGAAPHDNRFLYNGKELQADFGLGLYDYGARFYDPVLGRWDAPDPLAGEEHSLTPFRYGYNNPLRFIDPNGMLESTHTDKDGNVIAVYDDGYLGVYKHDDATTKAEIDKKREQTNTNGGGGELMGYTLYINSFAALKGLKLPAIMVAQYVVLAVLADLFFFALFWLGLLQNDWDWNYVAIGSFPLNFIILRWVRFKKLLRLTKWEARLFLLYRLVLFVAFLGTRARLFFSVYRMLNLIS